MKSFDLAAQFRNLGLDMLVARALKNSQLTRQYTCYFGDRTLAGALKGAGF